MDLLERALFALTSLQHDVDGLLLEHGRLDQLPAAQPDTVQQLEATTMNAATNTNVIATVVDTGVSVDALQKLLQHNIIPDQLQEQQQDASSPSDEAAYKKPQQSPPEQQAQQGSASTGNLTLAPAAGAVLCSFQAGDDAAAATLFDDCGLEQLQQAAAVVGRSLSAGPRQHSSNENVSCSWMCTASEAVDKGRYGCDTVKWLF
eukprot:gene10641-10799_t